MTIRHDGLQVTWLGYATVRIETPTGFVVYLDPGRYGVLDDYYARDADLVCITHDHHYDSDAIKQVAGETATLVVYENVDTDRIGRQVVPPEDLDFAVERVPDDAHCTVGEAEVWSLPAHNEPGGPHTHEDGSVTHPPGFGCGFLLSLADRTVFWPGDSDALDGFRELEVSLFLANIGGSIVMDRREAADLAEALDPDLVLPIHYDTFDLLAADAGAFAADVAGRGVPVVLDERSANQ